MLRLIKLITNAIHFINTKLFSIRVSKLNNKRHGFLLTQLRVITLAIKGFTQDKCLLRASALTYFTMFSIVPVIALSFAIAKGFGLEKNMQIYLLGQFSGQKEVLLQVFDFAHGMLARTKGGLIAGVGVIVLLYTVMKLLSNIEQSFNEIWQVKKGRGFVRMITDYLAIMIFAPIIILLSGGISVLVRSQVGNAMDKYSFLGQIGPVATFGFHALSVFLICLLLTFLYLVIPNTRVTFKSALMAGFLAGILIKLTEWVYITFQIGAGSYSAIYGSFAALPLFLLLLQTSWYIVLFGAELAYAYQNIEHFELEHEINNISHRYKSTISLLVMNKIVKSFVTGEKPLTSHEIAHSLDIPLRLSRNIIDEFLAIKIVNQTVTEHDKEFGYTPALSENVLTVKYLMDALDSNGVNEMQIHNSELDQVSQLLKDYEESLFSHASNKLIKDIA